MARILLIETATEVCSAAIAVDGRVVVMEETAHSLNHAALLTLQIAACAQRSGIALTELDAVAVSSGPGSYTSLRVGASVAKGICYALDKPLIAVDTLHALAKASFDLEKLQSSNPPVRNFYIPMLDARRQEVWLAVYNTALDLLMPAQPLNFENNLFFDFMQAFVLESSDTRWVIAGNGGQKLGSGKMDKETVFSPVNSCSAVHLAALAEVFFQNSDFQDVSYWTPVYMKPPNITTPSKKTECE